MASVAKWFAGMEKEIVEALAFHMACDPKTVDLAKCGYGLSEDQLAPTAIFCGMYNKDHQIAVFKHKDGSITVEPWDHSEDCCGYSCDYYCCCSRKPTGLVRECGCAKRH